MQTRKYLKNNKLYLFVSFALLVLLSSLLIFHLNTTQASANGASARTSSKVTVNRASSLSVTIDRTSTIGTSQFVPGITHVDNTLNYPWGNNDLAAVNRVKALITAGIPFENTHIMAWGADDPWPDPSATEPSNWGSLDSRLQLIMDTNGTPVITLCEAPWWMKGILQANGTTKLLTAAQEWSDDAYGARILDNKMDAWLHLVQRVAERYMVAPYNVRYFQVWNELKGYYNPSTNTYDYSTSPGDPSGPNAKHGYTYMYNLVYGRLLQVATSLGIPTASIKVGGPYVVMDTWSSANQSNPSNLVKPYGVYDQRPLDVIQYWLQHKTEAGFITVDGDNTNKDNINITDPFTASEKFADVAQWIRSLDPTTYPGAATLPIWWAEWSATPYKNTTNVAYNDAIESFAMIELLKAGGAVPLAWSGIGVAPGAGLWTNTIAGGGKPLPWYFSYKAFKDDFAPGTQIYKTTVSAPSVLAALASTSMVMLVNKTANKITVSVNGQPPVTLAAYQVSVSSYS